VKVWLNDRAVRLVKHPPASGEYHTVSTKNEISLLYHAFEADPALKELVLFGVDYDQCRADLFSLFHLVIAAGGFVKNERNEILFIFRRGHWDLPKGKLNTKKGRAEKKKAAAVREVMEETGIEMIDVVGKKDRTYHIFFEKRERYLKKTYWYEMRAPSTQALKPQVEEDITEVKWISENELDNVLEGAYPSLLKLFR
jgi:8-oxo-dGTP pyrophosphatase MutT (NUDIX family)